MYWVGSVSRCDGWATALDCLKPTMSSTHVHLGLDERRRLLRMREAKVPATRIATALGCLRSTIHREIVRNRWRDAEVPRAEGHWPLTAQDLAVRRRSANTRPERHAELRVAVMDRLCVGWSPEQIAGRLRVEPAAPHRLCHEAIYRFVYSPQGRSEEPARHPPARRRRRRPCPARKSRGAVFPDHAAIRRPPQTIEQRAEFGHWEAGSSSSAKRMSWPTSPPSRGGAAATSCCSATTTADRSPSSVA